MKTLKKRLAIVLSLILFMTGIFAMGGIAASKKADALSPNYYGGDTVYYFSDSTPILNDNEVRSVAGNMDVVYDIQSLISSQRLAYLVYTGYFWGFDDSSNTVVIVEIKAMKPDSHTLRDLFACLQYQNCKVIFISAYEEYSGFNYEDFFFNYGEEYQEYYRDVVWNYFAEGGDEGFEGIFNVFFERNTHILVHIPYSDLFWDITNSAENTEDFIYEFTDVETLYEYFGEVRLYAMGIWILDGSFYDFLLNAQQYLTRSPEEVYPTMMSVCEALLIFPTISAACL